MSGNSQTPMTEHNNVAPTYIKPWGEWSDWNDEQVTSLCEPHWQYETMRTNRKRKCNKGLGRKEDGTKMEGEEKEEEHVTRVFPSFWGVGKRRERARNKTTSTLELSSQHVTPFLFLLCSCLSTAGPLLASSFSSGNVWLLFLFLEFFQTRLRHIRG